MIDIVPVKEIPSNPTNTPLDNLMHLYSIAQRMEKICIVKNGIGLSAVQVGIPWKFFIYYNENEKKFNYIIDCEYNPLDENKYLSIEGCLSIVGTQYPRRFKVLRFENIEVQGKELLIENDGFSIKDFNKKLSKGLVCTLFQHEIDHQNNKLISDIGEEIFIQNGIVK